MNITIDPGAGPCFGVQKAIDKAEEVLQKENSLICMGDLIHNEEEMDRLSAKGMSCVSSNEVLENKPDVVLFRAHGEPPASYKKMENKGIQVIDATCPIVLKLQERIHKAWLETKKNNGRIVIYGNRNHAEVLSLQGHCDHSAIVIEKLEEVEELPLENPIYLFSQTTKYRSIYLQIQENILLRLQAEGLDSSHLIFSDSSCKIVAKRDVQLQEFVKDKDLIVFVSGSKSSNGKQLFGICEQSGVESIFISRTTELKKEMFSNSQEIGVSGATSTPKWLLEEVKQKIGELV